MNSRVRTNNIFYDYIQIYIYNFFFCLFPENNNGPFALPPSIRTSFFGFPATIFTGTKTKNDKTKNIKRFLPSAFRVFDRNAIFSIFCPVSFSTEKLAPDRYPHHLRGPKASSIADDGFFFSR